MILITLSDILDSVAGATVQATVSMVDSAKHVKIHGIELGLRNADDPDASQPNPIEIRYTQEFEIAVHKTVGQKPLTQCTIPDGLWEVEVKFNTLKGPDGGISEVLTAIRDMKAGPGLVETALFNSGKCMYLKRKEIVQPKGSKDFYHNVTINLIEASAGSD